MIKCIGFSVLFFLLISKKNAAQIEKTYFVSPGIKLGYTFGAGFTYGAILDAGVNSTSNSEIRNLKYGVSLGFTFIKVKKYTHRMSTISLMAQNDFTTIKLGIGKVKNPWGYSRRNKCKVFGAYVDMSFAYPSAYSPWIGLSYFKYKRANWAWFSNPYKTFYINYKYDALNPIYNAQEKGAVFK